MITALAIFLISKMGRLNDTLEGKIVAIMYLVVVLIALMQDIKLLLI